MDLYEEIINRKAKLSLVGLGYVGIPIAIAFAKKVSVIGFDINKTKIEAYKQGIDPTKEVGDTVVKTTTIDFTSEEGKLKEAKFHIIAVPTPINQDHTPDLRPLQLASGIVGRNLTKGSIVVYESTVYPGVTEEICVPILEKASGMLCGVDFKVGYSPERINPGDRQHNLQNIVKIVSGMDEETLEVIARVYELVVEAGVYRVRSIRIAEAAKVIENAQRDINIAFMNELSIIFHKLDLDTREVLAAAGTKWNFLLFYPGLVGGHCIGVDPYYLTYKAEQLGYHSQVILSGRQINDDMGKYIVQNLIKNLIMTEIPIKKAKVAILGITFKENCPDTRNSRIIDIIKELQEYQISPIITDPQADEELMEEQYGIKLTPFVQVKEVDAVIIAVAHKEFTELTETEIAKLYKKELKKDRILFDLKGIMNKESFEKAGYCYWRL